MTIMNTRAYSKTRHVFEMWNFNFKIFRNPPKNNFFGSSIHTKGQNFRPSKTFQGEPKVSIPLSSILPTGNPIGKLVSPIGKPVSQIGKPAQKQNRLAQLKKGQPNGETRGSFFFISGDICRGQKRVYKNMESL